MHITIVGAGYVGLTTGVCLAAKGHAVWLVEQMPDRIATIKDGKVPFYEPGLEDLLKQVLQNGNLVVTSDLASSVERSDATFIAVGTPNLNDNIDLSQVIQAALTIGKCLRKNKYHVVVVKSTVVPGTTDGVVRETLEEGSGLTAGDFGLCMNPEFLREGTAVEDFMDPDRIIIGQWDEQSGKVASSLYEQFSCPIITTTLRNAELVKYSSNALLSVLISFSNEIASICENLPGTDVETIMNGLHLDRRLSPIVNQKRVSPQILSYLRAGCGFGGSCLPKDVNALRAFARSIDVSTPLLDATIKVNINRGGQIVDLLEKSLGSLADRTVAVLGLAFKPDTDDLRESPALKIIAQLEAKHAKVRAYDPMVQERVPALAKTTFNICKTADEVYANADALVIATGWKEFKELDWQEVANKMRTPLILDGRRLLSSKNMPAKIILQSIGVANDQNTHSKADLQESARK